MAELLVKAVDAVHPDPEKDLRGSYKKGDIVVVQPNDHVWGSLEGPPTFVIVRCPGVTVEQVMDRLQPWAFNVAFTVVNSNLAIDGFRIRMANTSKSVSGDAGLTLAKVQAFLDLWNATFVSANGVEQTVTFDILISDAVQSVGFWAAALTDLVFTELDYVQATGIHTFSVDYTTRQEFLIQPTAFAANVAELITSRGCTLLSNTGGIATFTVDRLDVRERFRQDVTERLGVYRRRRYCFSAAQVDTVLGQGGSITVTPAQLASAVLDRQAQ